MIGFKLDTSDFRFFLKAISINSMKLLNSMVDKYNGMFQVSAEDAVRMYTEIGERARKRGDNEGAIKAFTKVLEADSGNVEILAKLGRIYLDVGLATEAIEVLKKATLLNNESAKNFYLLGSACFMVDDNEGALNALNEAININANYSFAYYKMGLVYDSMSKYDEAIEAYEKAISIRPNFVKAYQSIGLAYEGKGMREKAVQYFRKALEKEEKGI